MSRKLCLAYKAHDSTYEEMHDISHPQIRFDRLKAALQDEGIEMEVRCWHDTEVDWSSYKGVILLAVWDYTKHYEKFMRWLKHISGVTKVFNSHDMIAWNIDKSYIAEFASIGVPVPKTKVVRAAHDCVPQLVDIMEDMNVQSAIVKPVVGNASVGIFTVDLCHIQDDQKKFKQHLEIYGSMLVQEYIPTVNKNGEWSVFYIDGIRYHSIHKSVSSESCFIGPHPVFDCSAIPPEVIITTADDIIRKLPCGVPSYARVDLTLVDEYTCFLMEVELIDPTMLCIASEETIKALVKVVMDKIK